MERRSQLFNFEVEQLNAGLHGSILRNRADNHRNLSKMEQLAIGIWLSYFDEEKRTNEQTEIIGALSDVRCRHRQALSVYSGLGRRKEPHAERKYQAAQAIEQDCGPRDSPSCST
jgi:hypothetical protein